MRSLPVTKAAPPNGTDHPPVRYEDPNMAIPSPFNNERMEESDPAFLELMESIRTHGIIQPIIVRPMPDPGQWFVDPGTLDGKPGFFVLHREYVKRLNGLKGGEPASRWSDFLPPCAKTKEEATARIPQFEIVAGERRWRAARKLQSATIPMIVRPADDALAIELQTIENEERKDLSPIQKAAKYRQLLDEYEKGGLNAEKAMARLTEKILKSKSAIYEALSLLKLPVSAKEAVASGRLPASHAALISQLSDSAELQLLVTKKVLEPEQYTDTEAGATGEGAVLAFRELKEIVQRETALAPARKKWQAAMSAHLEKGGEVLTEAEMEKVVSWYGSGYVSAGYVAANQETTDYVGCGNYPGKSYRELMGAKAPPAILAHDREYKVLEIYRTREVTKAILANGHKRKPRESYGGGSVTKTDPEKEAARKQRAERMELVGKKAMELLAEGAGKIKPKFPWRIFLLWLDDEYYFSGSLKKEIKGADKAPQNKILALLVEIMLRGRDEDLWDEYGDCWGDPRFVELCKHYGVDLKRLEKELVPAAAPKDPPSSKSRASGKSGKKGQTLNVQRSTSNVQGKKGRKK